MEAILYLLEDKVEEGLCSKLLYFAIKKAMELDTVLVLKDFFALVPQSNGSDSADLPKITKIIQGQIDYYKGINQRVGVELSSQKRYEELRVIVNNYHNS